MNELTRRDFLTAAAATLLVMTERASSQTPPAADLRKDPAWSEAKVKNISDEELHASLDVNDIASLWERIAARVKFTGEADFLVSREQATRWFEPQRATVLAQAEDILHHKLYGWGPTPIQHGKVVDFNADYGKSGKYGFHYWYWARPLVQAFLITGDEKYLAEFDALFNAWYEQREKVHGGWPGLDVIYYELGLGVRNRLFLEASALPHPSRSAQTHERMLKTCLGAARWLYEEEKLGYRAGNWQIIGSFGLAHIALMIPEFKESDAWLALACERMLEHIRQDFFPDGCHSERCPSSYSAIAYRDPRNLAVLLTADERRRDLAETIRKPLEKQIEFFLHTVAPDGYEPGINDGARAPLMPAILQDGYDLFGRRDSLFVMKSLTKRQTSEHGAEPADRSIHFAPSGFTVMRSDWTPNARYMLINHGPTGGGHSHADALSFELHAFGKALAIDSGIGDTYDDPDHARWYVRSAAHNMITIDGEDLDRPAAEGKDVLWQSEKTHDYFAATHHGYAQSKGIIHRRHIVFVKPRFFVIYDVIDASAAKQPHELHWNLHAATPLKIEGSSIASESAPGLVIRVSEPWPAKLSKEIACVNGIRGFTRQQAKIDWLTLNQTIAAGETKKLAVVLYPFGDAVPPVELSSPRANEFVVRSGGRIDQLIFGKDQFELRQAMP